MRRLGLCVALCLVAPALCLVSASTLAAESEVQQAYIKVKLAREGSAYSHPGYLVASDEEGVFVIKIDGRSHEISVSMHESPNDKLLIHVVYKIEGRQQHEARLQVEPGEDAEIVHGKTTLTINVDPQGSADSSRGDDDQIEGPGDDADDPLGGLR